MNRGRIAAAAWGLLSSVVLAGAAGAQSPHPQGALPATPPLRLVSGFVTPYEIDHIARRAGFLPLTRPLREGRIYVLRATDFRGVLMRIVLDAGTGGIRDATPIVADTDDVGMASPPYPPPTYYGPSQYGLPAYEIPPAYGPIGYGGLPPDDESAEPIAPPNLAAPRHRAQATHRLFPPLPRPRPAKLAGEASSRSAAAVAPKQSNAAAKLPPATRAGKPPAALPLND